MSAIADPRTRRSPVCCLTRVVCHSPCGDPKANPRRHLSCCSRCLSIAPQLTSPFVVHLPSSKGAGCLCSLRGFRSQPTSKARSRNGRSVSAGCWAKPGETIRHIDQLDTRGMYLGGCQAHQETRRAKFAGALLPVCASALAPGGGVASGGSWRNEKSVCSRGLLRAGRGWQVSP